MAGPPGGSGQRHDGIAYELVHRLDVPVPQMGGTAAECRAVLFRTVAGGCRPGYRSAEDLALRYSTTTLVSRYAAGGTAG